MPSSPSMNVTLLLQDAVLTNPGSYTASAAPSPSLILPRSAPLTTPFSMGTSYSWPVRLSRTVRESFTPPTYFGVLRRANPVLRLRRTSGQHPELPDRGGDVPRRLAPDDWCDASPRPCGLPDRSARGWREDGSSPRRRPPWVLPCSQAAGSLSPRDPCRSVCSSRGADPDELKPGRFTSSRKRSSEVVAPPRRADRPP